jgi:hypothetical protein
LQIFTPDPLACKENSEDFSKTIGVYGNGHNEMYKDISASMLSNVKFPVTKTECFNTLKLLNSFYLSDEKSNWVNVSDKKLSSRLGRPNDKISALYRTKYLDD